MSSRVSTSGIWTSSFVMSAESVLGEILARFEV